MNELLWYFSRATGVISMVLLTTTLVLGMTLSGRRSARPATSTVVAGLHRWLGLGMVVFVVGHVTTAIVETYVSIGPLSALVPFTAGYQPLWVGLGTIAFDILLAVAVTSALRHRISERVWRGVHLASYLLWPTALVHGFLLGTSDQPLLRLVTVACGVVGMLAVSWRIQATHHDREHRRSVTAQGWS
ncbi:MULTISPECIES: ferric reductase-like transmembrane domain-containing protein [unclassified Nocardioides]|uniref:ferric reductase-like transmembrane domain-containing protein n=1 Tax=unclassified Nocardioides TaxID=2615069 RepID=UPI0009F02EC0|nr:MULTISPECIES: ferric reductase-like transmembrane domain-containing protein [unclassified Nocardioides]GAW50978.1 uncharacterized protein PD653B2_3314 [Nocardioides sp. PD653-B2]GAW56295.1 uncharacterized protein PD653_3731 [Nocardioides sp. PD653]